MSNTTKILIEKLKLQRLLRERVFVKWKDQLEILLVVPLDANFADASKPCSISNVDDLSFHEASAIHDAKISDSLYVNCIQFDLSAKGFIVMEKKSTETIKPWTKTSAKLLLGLESLSNTTTFTVYIKPNSYALVGLEQLHNRLSNTSNDTRKTNMKEIYIEQVPELVEWKSLPPAYTKKRVQVPRSPPIIFEQKTPSTNTSEVAIAETPARTPTGTNSPTGPNPPTDPDSPTGPNSPNSPTGPNSPTDPVSPIGPNSPTGPDSTSVHSIFSPTCEELSDGEINLDIIEKEFGIDFDVDSDEEQLAKKQFASLDSREPNQQLDYNLEVSQILLNSKLAKWMETVCSALFFYDPLDSDSDNTLGLWEKRNLWLIKDIARTIPWADKMRSGAEISSSLLEQFIKPGDAARTVALDSSNKGVYLKQKSLFITYILAEFGKPGGISKENSEPVSRKSLGTDSNVSKRVKM
ncbi:hypothetical protein SBOR_0137 [Sclerotinia borealis F-4128]|uniref:Uncharacterized protein n=1 Tax=Sclerotinia borealis (strain F-4128) TaxID=1432307 RepID=W9CXT1_SCLBF|nr:hypothetical protein SBOR_0137 [Sclerotinia borealis F-4128]